MSDVDIWQQFEDWEKTERERSELNMAQDDTEILYDLRGNGDWDGQDSFNNPRSSGEESEGEGNGGGVGLSTSQSQKSDLGNEITLHINSILADKDPAKSKDNTVRLFCRCGFVLDYSC